MEKSIEQKFDDYLGLIYINYLNKHFMKHQTK